MKMRNIFASLGLVLCIAAFGAAIHAPLYLGKWQLVFADEFDGNTLNRSNWDVEVNCWGGGNNEKQCYTDRPNNIFVQDSALNLRAIAETYKGSLEGCTLNLDNSCTRTMPVTSGRIRTYKALHGSWKYGRFEIRAQMPTGDFTWPAIWMLPTDSVYGPWAASGEIDIMEYRGQDRTKMLHTLHFGGGWPNNRYWGTTKTYPFDFTKEFHTFTMEWDKDQMRFWVDDTLSHTQSLQLSFGNIYKNNGAPFDQRFHMILNLAIGGNFFGGNYGAQDINKAKGTWTQPFRIDFVRVYRDASNDPIISECPVIDPDSDIVSNPTTINIDAVEIPAAADGFVWAGVFAEMSFYPNNLLFVKTGTAESSNRIAYLRFNTSAIRKDAQIKSAELQLFGQAETFDDTTVTSCAVYSVDSTDWNEQTLTWKTKPTVQPGEIASSNVTSIPAYISFDVTNQVAADSSAGLQALAFALQTLEPVPVMFASRRSLLHPPKLVVTFAPIVVPPTQLQELITDPIS